jgi:hypothetical protein
MGLGFLAGMSAVLLAVGSLAASPGSNPPATPNQGTFVVHEWGTFLSVQGSDGVTLGGMVESDEVLPPFVEARGIATWQRSMMFQKMETPVTYFYTDRPRDVQVRIDMPKGVLTHWFPAVRHYGPNPTSVATTPNASSYLEWRKVSLIPATQPLPNNTEKTIVLALKNGQVRAGILEGENDKQIRLFVDPDTVLTVAKDQIEERTTVKLHTRFPQLNEVGRDQTWRFARETDAALVKVRTWDRKGEYQTQLEKFLFYRGLGTFTLPLEVRSAEGCKAGAVLALHNQSNKPLQGLFAVNVEKDTIQFGTLADLAGQATREVAIRTFLTSPQPLQEGVPQVKSAVAAALVAAGLYPKEAQAMVNTWEKSYFRTEGLRILYILPRDTVDRVIPIQIKPAPDKLVRVMVGRVEVLTPERERRIEKFVADLGAKEFAVRNTASRELARLGRISEPALRRVAVKTTDPEVRSRAETLIHQVGSGQ